MRPEAGCLGPLLDVLWYSLRAGLLGACQRFPLLCSYTALVVHRTRTPSNSLVWSSHPYYQARGYGGGRDSTVDSTVTIRVRLRDDRQAHVGVSCTS